VVLASIPVDLAAPVVVVFHLHPSHESRLATILSRSTRLPVKQAEAGDELVDGHVFVGPPNAHLRVASDHTLRLGHDPPIRLLRPSADIFLTSLALAFGPGALAVILSGAGHDGAAGAAAIRSAGGSVVAQDEQTSEYFGMPGAAVEEGAVDQIRPLGELASAIVDFVRA
jgi:two-component system chemotaxis response regulator CheB